MDPRVKAAIIAGVFSLVVASITALLKFWEKHPQLFVKGSGHVGEAVFEWMKLSKRARKKLARSQFIRIGGTGHALMALVNSAKEPCSILAICGYKGDFSSAYYEENFNKFRAVSRVFSYEAIRREITLKKVRYALNGLEMHLNANRNDIEVILIPKNTFIKDLGGGNFAPPLSFGLAILRDGNDVPQKAVIHWEMDAEPLRHLIAIEGVIIDEGQKEVLNELVELYERIVHSNVVKSSKKDKSTIAAVCDELEEFWKSMSYQ